jgi:2-polyprenyl-3-methyl-5-hydroxy-6-metoxy-1,4-benzoquinol methylase
MNAALKSAALSAASALSLLYRLVPEGLRRVLVAGLLAVESRIGPPDEGLRRLFRAQDDLERLINERAMALGKGEHPKHRLTRYHDFFVARIPAGARVLDVGCGYGAVARSIARRIQGARVTGIDSSAERIAEARAAANPPNLDFVLGDALQAIPQGPWDTVVLSNILEHLDGRVEFLRHLKEAAAPRLILIRVPLFERNWQVPMRRELGIGYFSDPTHVIEHTLEEFEREMRDAGLEIADKSVLWGEIWAECRPKGP